MKVFISWSGENTSSHKIALALRDWLPLVINCIKPFVSSEDIQIGEQGLLKIEKLLKDSDFGIICVTKENYKAPWVLFEAGALSNNPNKIPVAPFLFGLTPSDISGSPLTQFQSIAHYDKNNINKNSIKKLIQSLNDECGDSKLHERVFERTFEMWYPELETVLNSIDNEDNIINEVSTIDIDKNRVILEEILEITRKNQKALSNGVVMYNINDKETDYEFIVKYSVNDGRVIDCPLEIKHNYTVSDILNEIYFFLEGRVEAFTYLISWILQEKNTGRKLVVSEVQDLIPAHNVFLRNSIWEIKFLETPYVPNSDAIKRTHKLPPIPIIHFGSSF
jgi:hypothetical protein